MIVCGEEYFDDILLYWVLTLDLENIQTHKGETRTCTRTYRGGETTVVGVFHQSEEGRVSLMTVGSRVASGTGRSVTPVTTSAPFTAHDNNSVARQTT